MSRYEELRALAAAIPEGGWTYNSDFPDEVAANFEPILKAASPRPYQAEAVAQYIAAASPDVILALLDERERLHGALRSVWEQWPTVLPEPLLNDVEELLGSLTPEAALDRAKP